MGVAGLQACQVISALMRWPENFYHRTTGDAATNTPSFPYSHSTYLAKEKKKHLHIFNSVIVHASAQDITTPA